MINGIAVVVDNVTCKNATNLGEDCWTDDLGGEKLLTWYINSILLF